MTESVMSTHKPAQVSLTDAERQALRQFVTQSLRLRDTQGTVKAQKTELAKTVKDKRARLQEWIRSQDSKCFVIPRARFQEAERELSAQGMPSLPPYLRLQRNTTDAAITNAVAETAVMDLDVEILKEYAQEKDLVTALKEAIVQGARISIRSSKEAVALAPSQEKGVRPIDIPEVPEDIAEEMIAMFRAQQSAKATGSMIREKTTDISSSIKTLQPQVAEVLKKTGRTSQQIQLDGVKGLHKIVRKETSKSQKVTIKVFEEAVSNVLSSMRFRTRNLEDFIASYEQHKKDIVKRVQLQLSSMPKTTTTTVKLSTIDDEEEEE